MAGIQYFCIWFCVHIYVCVTYMCLYILYMQKYHLSSSSKLHLNTKHCLLCLIRTLLIFWGWGRSSSSRGSTPTSTPSKSCRSAWTSRCCRTGPRACRRHQDEILKHGCDRRWWQHLVRTVEQLWGAWESCGGCKRKAVREQMLINNGLKNWKER